MAISTLSTQVKPPRLATRAEYQRALTQLTLAWPQLVHEAAERDLVLNDDDHLFLSLVLSLKPDREMKQGGRRVSNDGNFQSCARGVAEWIGWRRQRVNACVSRLSAAGLLWGIQLEKGDWLQAGTPSFTNIVRYRADVDVIFAAYESMPRGYFTSKNVSLRGPKSGPSDGPNYGPSLKCIGNDLRPTPKPPSEDSESGERRRARAPSAHQAAGETPPSAPGACGDSAPESSPAPEDAPREKEHGACRVVAALAAAWDALRIPERNGTISQVRKSERTLLTKRLAEVGREELEAAIVGASTKPREFWATRVDAACAFVFRSAEKVHEYAQLGRAELARRAARQDRGDWRRPANDSGPDEPC